MAKRPRQAITWFVPTSVPVCPLCDRDIPESQQDKHHLVPKTKGGKETQLMHRICHRQIHALFTETELAQRYNTAEALLEHPEVQKFVAWVKKKPPEFYESAKMSNRKR